MTSRTPLAADSIALAGPRAHWWFAAVIALALHGGFAAAMVLEAQTAEEEETVDGSAMPIDLTAQAFLAPEEPPARIGPPAPEVAAQEATPVEAAEKPPPPAEKTDVLLEQQAPVESAVELPKPSPEKVETEAESEEEAKEPTPPQPDPLAAQAPQEAAAPPPVAAPPAPEARSIAEGLTPSQRRSRNTWERALVTHLDRHKRYPEAARDSLVSGEAVIEFTMDRAGAVIASRLVRSSGSTVLDAEAIAMPARAAPLPLPPSAVDGAAITLLVPVRFRLR